MPTVKQIKGAFESLLGVEHAKVPKRPPLRVEEPVPHTVPQEEDEVLTWEDMDIAKAKADTEAYPVDAQMEDLQDFDALESTLSKAEDMHKQAKLVYGNEPQLPATVLDPAAFKRALGPAYPSLIHFSDGAMEDMAGILSQQGKGRTFLTSITDEAVGKLTPLNDPFIGHPSEIEDVMRAYDFERGYPYVPRLQATIDARGNIIVQTPSSNNAQAWNALMALSRGEFNESFQKFFPVALDFDKPVFEQKKITGEIGFVNADGRMEMVPGVNITPLKRRPEPIKIEPTSAEWVEAPLTDAKDAKNRVNILFSDVTQRTGYEIGVQKLAKDSKKLGQYIWPRAAKEEGKQGRPLPEPIERARASYYPRDEKGEAFFERWFPDGSDGRKAISQYTKDSPYKARLVDPNAPKDAPLVIARGAQGKWEFINQKTGEPLVAPTMDPRISHETGMHTGPLSVAEYFALRGTVHGDDLQPFRSNYARAQKIGRTIIQGAISGDPKVAALWDQLQQEVHHNTRWGTTAPVMGYADGVHTVRRPTHDSLMNAAFELLTLQSYAPLKKAIQAQAKDSHEAVVKAMTVLSKGNADISFFVTNATRPLMLWDVGGFRPDRIANQLMQRPEFAEDVPTLVEALRIADDQFLNSEQGMSVFANTEVQKVIEKHGYDHVAYVNTVEYPGVPSFMFWRKDTLRPVESFGVPLEATKLITGPMLAVGLAFKLGMPDEAQAGEVDRPQQTKTWDGYPAVKNKDGTVSTRLTATVEVEELNGGKPTNIPTIWKGKKLSVDEAIKEAIDSGIEWPSFKTVDDAVKEAKAVSANL